MDAVGVPSRMPRNVDIFNNEHARFILRKVLEVTQAGMKVGLLGLAYKPGTNVIERSFAIDLASWLANEQRQVVAWDPLAMEEARRAVSDGRVSFVPSLKGCIESADLSVILLPLPEVTSLDWKCAAGKTIVDCWRCLPDAGRQLVGRYIPLGIGVDENLRAWLQTNLGKRLSLLTT